MLKAFSKKYTLNFIHPAGTSRGSLLSKDSWFIILQEKNDVGIGECSLLKGLSIDDRPDYPEKIKEVINLLNRNMTIPDDFLNSYPSIRFGLEMALLDVHKKENHILFPSAFTHGKDSIPINGLVWMGTFDFMKKQIKEKIQSGFSCIKLKIGAIDFEQELSLLRNIRKEFSKEDIELRVDANGAFAVEEALEKLKRLSEFDLHSIEQPIKAGQWIEMANLCEKSPFPIALDEELIGVLEKDEKKKLLQTINPQYIILKPSLIGGFEASQEWINLADKNKTGWWVTSALESNIGLNAIAQWTYSLDSKMPQGLGTGQLYSNNFNSPLEIRTGQLYYNPDKNWQLNNLIK